LRVSDACNSDRSTKSKIFHNIQSKVKQTYLPD
jgi:hypothetical protein